MRRLNIALCAWVTTTSLLLPAFGQFCYPDDKGYGTPENYGLPYESITVNRKGGTILHGRFVPATATVMDTGIHFHGNTQNMSAHSSFVSSLPAEGFNVFAFNYRGYGKSSGRPTRRGVYKNAVVPIRLLKSRNDIGQEKIFILGQSLGGAVAVRAVASVNVTGIHAVVVESTFDLYKRIVRDKGSNLPVNLFISDDLNPAPVIAKLSPVPILCIHGTASPVGDRKKTTHGSLCDTRPSLSIKTGRIL